MSFFKCKMCGGDIGLSTDKSVGTCEYCGTKQTLPKLDDDRRANLYDRANHFRRNNEFDKAMGIYEQILNEDSSDAEAYWSIVLCRYGIEYVEDPGSRKRVPTVNRTQFTSIFDDDNYKQALLHADGYQKELYEEEAAAINEIQKGILAISQKEEPFDVFICYKETDAGGRRTQDSVLANDLYHQLTQEGFKVFFARITLEDKLGTAYEPYIFAALNSARVMVVIGTKPEYFNAVWVKNEWSRYLALIKQGEKKLLIPAYREMDPYELPEEFSHLQAQDMSKLGFMQDLIRGVKKVAEVDKPQAAEKERVLQSEGNNKLTALLKRGIMALEDGEWRKADEFFEEALNLDAECAEAYLGKSLAAEEFVSLAALVEKRREPVDLEGERLIACKPAVDRINAAVEQYCVPGYLNEAAIRKEFDGFDRSYRSILSNLQERLQEMEKYFTDDKLRGRALHFAKGAFAESLNAAKEWIIEPIQEQIAKEEAENRATAERLTAEYVDFLTQMEQKIAAQYAEAKRRKSEEEARTAKVRKITCIGTGAAAVLAVYILVTEVLILAGQYKRAEALQAAKDYDGAFEIFHTLNYKDSSEKANECISLIMQKGGLRPVGSAFLFGSYEQDNNTVNGKEEIEWEVLDIEDGRALLISKYALDCQPYNNTYTDTTWEECTLRSWLNGTFYNGAFSSEHQKRIASTTVKADKNPAYGTSPGNDTVDKVFLLSIPEVEQYFRLDEGRKCVPTAYAIAQGIWTSDTNTTGGKATCWWWLRSPGYDSNHAADVNYDGAVYRDGSRVDHADDAVRPALWINLES